jgi:hypothetical protein
VIDALNADLSYDRFVRLQLVGDLEGSGPDGAAATGFWVAGAHNTVVGGSERMKRLARGDELEEVIGTLGQTFVGLTLQCARCHDHKFDPVSQADYYRLASAISGLGYGERTVAVPDVERQLAELDAELAALRTRLAALDARGRARVAETQGGPVPPPALARWEFEGDLRDSVGGLHGKAVGRAHVAHGSLVLDGVAPPSTPLPVALAFDTDDALDALSARVDGGLEGALEVVLAEDAGSARVTDPFFGEVVEGQNVVQAVEKNRTGAGDKPIAPVVITASGQLA